MYINCHVVIFAETMDQRDLEKEQLLEDIIFGAGDVFSFLNDTMVWKEMMKAPVIEQWRRKDMIMMAPVNNGGGRT